jgi:hypothetical protein
VIQLSKQPFTKHGVGLAREEFIIAEKVRIHQALIDYNNVLLSKRRREKLPMT